MLDVACYPLMSATSEASAVRVIRATSMVTVPRVLGVIGIVPISLTVVVSEHVVLSSCRYVFEDCRSTSIDVGASGGALSSVEDVVIELHATGSVYFKDCVAEDSGGAIYSGRNIEISARSGSVQFERCHAGSGNGHAMIAHSGDLHISALTRVVLAGMDSNVGSAVFVRSATLPVGSGILPADVFALESLLASKTLSQGDDECPVGSRFSWDASGAPIPGRCPMCGSGTASLVTSSVVIDRKIAAPEVGMRTPSL